MGLIEFQRLKLENFRSWENLDVSLGGKGAVLITGKNGAGKSNIFAALTWALFGKTFQGVSPQNLIRHGASPCRVAVSFRNTSGQLIKVCRQRMRWEERVRLDDGTGVQEMGVKEANAHLPQILGISWETFIHLVFIGFGVNRFFLQLSDGEKKTLLENLLHLARFHGCASEAAHRAKVLNSRGESLRARFKSLQASLNRLEQEVAQAQGQGVTELEGRIRELQYRIQGLDEGLEQEGGLGGLENVLSRLSGELDKHKSLLVKLDFQASSLESQAARIKALGGKTCLECGRDLAPEEARDLVVKRREQLGKLDAIRDPLREKIADLQEEREEIHAKVSRAAEISLTKKGLLKEMEALREERERVSLGYGELLSKQRCYYQKKLKACQEKRERISTLKPYYDFWVAGFGRRGIQIDILRQVLPRLEECSNRYLGYLSDRFRLRFDLKQKMFVTEVLCQDLGEMHYRELSAGERRRLDLAVSLALRDIVEHANGISVGLTVLDELVENLDAEGVEAFSELLKHLSGERSTFVISHNSLAEGCFDQVWEVRKRDGVSELLGER